MMLANVAAGSTGRRCRRWPPVLWEIDGSCSRRSSFADAFAVPGVSPADAGDHRSPSTPDRRIADTEPARYHGGRDCTRTAGPDGGGLSVPVVCRRQLGIGRCMVDHAVDAVGIARRQPHRGHPAGATVPPRGPARSGNRLSVWRSDHRSGRRSRPARWPAPAIARAPGCHTAPRVKMAFQIATHVLSGGRSRELDSTTRRPGSRSPPRATFMRC